MSAYLFPVLSVIKTYFNVKWGTLKQKKLEKSVCSSGEARVVIPGVWIMMKAIKHGRRKNTVYFFTMAVNEAFKNMDISLKYWPRTNTNRQIS